MVQCVFMRRTGQCLGTEEDSQFHSPVIPSKGCLSLLRSAGAQSLMCPVLSQVTACAGSWEVWVPLLDPCFVSENSCPLLFNAHKSHSNEVSLGTE